VHAPTDPLPLGALAPTAPAKSAPMAENSHFIESLQKSLIQKISILFLYEYFKSNSWNTGITAFTN